jgi:hypothetical protein
LRSGGAIGIHPESRGQSMAEVRFLGDRLWDEITTVEKNAMRRQVAVAFLTDGAVKRLLFAKGDTLVVNA